MADDVLDAARTIIQAESVAVGAVAAQVDHTLVAVAEKMLACAGKVFVAGVGTSGAVARRMAHLLSVCGTPAVFFHPADALHGSLGAITSGDLVVAISKGGGSAELNEFVSRSRARGAYVVALTARPDSALGTSADLTVRITTPQGADPGDMIAMGSALAVSAWGDALAVVLMRLRGYSWNEFLFTHPGGAVGAMNDVPFDLSPLNIGPDGAGPDEE